MSAQKQHDLFIYLSPERHFGNFNCISEILNFQYKEKYSAQIGFTICGKTSASRPDDYVGDNINSIISLFYFGALSPMDVIFNTQLMGGRVINTSHEEIRFNLLGGFGYTLIDIPSNWEYRNTTSIFARNYTYDHHIYNTISLIIHPTVEFPIGRILGLQVSTILIFNKDYVVGGIGFGYMIGLLRNKCEVTSKSLQNPQ